MPTSIPRLTDLPVEVLEQVLLHLPSQDVIKVEAISRRFQDLTRRSPALQCKRDLFSAGFIENPRNPCDFAQRRKLCEGHERKWSDAGRATKTTHQLPEELDLRLFTTIGWNLLAYCSREDGRLSFLRVPPVTSQKPPERWSIPSFPFRIMDFAAYPPDDILAVAGQKGRSVWIHFLNLSDGSPCRSPPSNVIMWEFPQGVCETSVTELAVTSSRVLMHVYCWQVIGPEYSGEGKISVWDWVTGDLVLSLPSIDESMVVEQNTTVTFLDEFRIMAFTPQVAPDSFEFTIFDTLVSRGHPVSSRRFRLPPKYHDWIPSVHVDGDRCLGTLDRDRPLTADPTQAVLVVRLIRRNMRVLFIVRMQTLIEHERSTIADAWVSWDVWGRDAVAMEIQRRGRTRGGPYPLVQGARVIFAKMYDTPGVEGNHHQPHLCIFDFSRRGCGTLPLWDKGDGIERRALFEEGRKLLLEGDEGMVEWGFDPLGDGRFIYLGDFDGSGDALHVWDLI